MFVSVFQITDKESVDRDGQVTVTVKGATQDANDAKRSILDLVSSNSNWNSDRGGGGGGGRQFDRSDNRSDSSRNFDRRSDSSRNNDSRSNEHKDTVEIYPGNHFCFYFLLNFLLEIYNTFNYHAATDKVGCVIGRGGETIKGIQNDFKVRVNVDKNTNFNGKSTVTVSGNQNDVSKAIAKIRELVGESNYGSEQNGYGSQSQAKPQETMEFEVIDWQAAARESVSLF